MILNFKLPSACTTIFSQILILMCLMPTISTANPITTTDLLQNLRKGEPWDRGVLTATKMVMFQQSASGGTDATSVSKITLAYFTSNNCTGSKAGTGFYTTPNGTFFTISVGTPFGIVASSTWNVGSTLLSIADMTTIQSISVTFKSTNNNTPQANFSSLSYACIPVTCTAGPSGVCTSGSGTQSFTLKTTAAVGDPADGGVIACMGGGLNNLIAASSDSATPFTPGVAWAPANTSVPGAQSDTDGATNTAAVVTAFGASTTYASGLCQAYTTAGGYTSGWFLPAKDQLNCLYTNRVAIGGFDTSTNGYYWTSTEYAALTTSAWYQTFNDGTQSPLAKNGSLGARCIRVN